MIYSVAESGGELEELLNPDFSPEQMQLIADVQTRTDAIHRSAVDDVLNPLTSKPMTPEEVNHARRQHNLPLDSGAETEQPVQPKQEPMNFRITDDDLGAGGAKTKFKANIEAIRLLQTLDDQKPDLLPSIVVQSDGKFITSTASGFDNATVRKVRELLHHEKFLENGTAERARESGTEQNYNMIDGCVNNVPKKPRVIGGRVSVLDRLHIKQAERARKDNAQVQQQERTRKN